MSTREIIRLIDRAPFHWRERKMNKGTDMQYVAGLLLHNTTNHYQALYQISES